MDCIKEKPQVQQHLTLLSCIDRFLQVIVNTIITNSMGEVLLLEQGVQKILQLLQTCRQQYGTIYIVGNGGSAAIASHAVIDFINMAKMKAMSMLDSAVTTCLSNDYGYPHMYEKQLLQFARDGDVLIAISSSGRSLNILNAVKAASSMGAKVITMSGFSIDNPLRLTGNLNLWLNSDDYGQIEIGHAFILHNLTDRLKQ